MLKQERNQEPPPTNEGKTGPSLSRGRQNQANVLRCRKLSISTKYRLIWKGFAAPTPNFVVGSGPDFVSF
jgi:hypothetical protein